MLVVQFCRILPQKRDRAGLWSEATACQKHESGLSATVLTDKADEALWKRCRKMLENRFWLNLFAVLVQIALNGRVCESYIVNFKKICVIHGIKIMKKWEKEK